MPIAATVRRSWAWISARPKTVSICLLLLALGLLAAQAYKFVQVQSSTSEPIQFRADLQTRNLSFTIDSWTTSAGIFNSGSQQVNLTLGSEVVLTSESGSVFKCLANSAFTRVNLLRIYMPAGLRVALDSYKDGRLGYTLTPRGANPGKNEIPYLTMGISDADQRGVACVDEHEQGGQQKQVYLSSGEWRVNAPAAGDALEFNVQFLPESKDVSSRKKNEKGSASKELEAQDPEPEEFIPVLDATNINFPNSGPLAGSHNKLHLFHPNSDIGLSDGFQVEGTSKTIIKKLAFDSRSALLSVNLVGYASHLRVKIGEDELDEHRSALAKYRPRSLSSFLNSGSSISTILQTLGGFLSGLMGCYVAVQLWWKKRRANRRSSIPDDIVD